MCVCGLLCDVVWFVCFMRLFVCLVVWFILTVYVWFVCDLFSDAVGYVFLCVFVILFVCVCACVCVLNVSIMCLCAFVLCCVVLYVLFFVGTCVCVILCVLDVLLCFVIYCAVLYGVLFLMCVVPKRTCSVGCTIEESNDQGNVHGKNVTTVLSQNLGAMFGVQAVPLPQNEFVCLRVPFVLHVFVCV